MKISISQFKRQRNQRGSAVVVTLALLGIMLICVAANTVAVRSLGRELKLIEKQQVRRLQSEPAKRADSTSPSINPHQELGGGTNAPHDQGAL